MNTLSANLQSLLDNRLRYLPPITGAAIQSIDWSSLVIEIGRKYGLHIDEMEDFQAVVLKAMIGLIAPADFENQLITALALSPANADKVITDINVKIFGPIHDYVMRQGKPIDGMNASGIVLEKPDSVPSTGSFSASFGKPVDIDFGANSTPIQTSEQVPEQAQAPVADLASQPLPKRNFIRELALLHANRNAGDNHPVI